jgi:hypothetical protein
MSVISVLTVQNGAAVPAGVTRASTRIDVTDSAGAAQSQSLTGTESPAWTATFTVAPGVGSVIATDIDTNGATIGTPVKAPFDTGTGTVGGAQLQTSGLTVTVVTP